MSVCKNKTEVQIEKEKCDFKFDDAEKPVVTAFVLKGGRRSKAT